MTDVAKSARVQITIDAGAERIWSALTDGDELAKWFIEETDVSLAENRYVFWGVDAPDTPDRAPERFEIVDSQPPNRLAYRWLVYGAETQVTYALEPRPDGETQVKIEHDGLPDQQTFWKVASFWSEMLDNLRAWVERQSTGAWFSYNPYPEGDVHESVEINASPEEIFPFLIEPEHVERWMTSEHAEIEPQVGGKYEVAGWTSDGPFKILDLEPNRKLSYSWNNEKFGYETVVTWTLDGSGGKTTLTLVHSGFAAEHETDNAYHGGWHAYLVNIKHYVEEGESWIPPHFEMVAATTSAVEGA